MDLACQIALDATSTVLMDDNGRKEIDIKRYAKVEKVGACTALVITNQHTVGLCCSERLYSE